MYSILLFVCAAPVPPPPKALNTEALVGLWDYKYGEQREGLMLLQANGIYFSRHSPQSQMIYCGLWWVEGDTLCLKETSYYPEAADRKWSRNWASYRFKFDLSKWPCYTAKTAFATEVVLSGRKEPDTAWLPAMEPDW
jgi:hypothetical protein